MKHGNAICFLHWREFLYIFRDEDLGGRGLLRGAETPHPEKPSVELIYALGVLVRELRS